MATQKLDKDGKKILDNMKKALPKLTKLQKKNLVTGTEFLASFTEYSDSSSNSSAVTQKGGGGNVKSRSELDNVVLEVVNLLSEKDITICESSYVLEQCNTVIANSTKIQRIKDQISLYHVEYLIWLLTLFQYHLRMDERQETDYQHHHLQRNAHYISLLPNDIEYQK